MRHLHMRPWNSDAIEATLAALLGLGVRNR